MVTFPRVSKGHAQREVQLSNSVSVFLHPNVFSVRRAHAPMQRVTFADTAVDSPVAELERAKSAPHEDEGGRAAAGELDAAAADDAADPAGTCPGCCARPTG